MSKNDPKIHYDGFQVINQGVDSGNAPNIIGRQRLAWAVNTTQRGGFPQTRPGFSRRILTFPDAPTSAAFQGLFQHLGTYVVRTGGNRLIFSIAGRFYTVNVDDNTYPVVDITGTMAKTATLEKTWSSQGEEFWVSQNNHDAAFIWDGSSTIDRVIDLGMPTGNVMNYALGRFWVAGADGHSYVASNLVGSNLPSGFTSTINNRDAILYFDHNTYLAEGGSFSMQSNLGTVTAIRSYANIDTSLGQGPVQVFGGHGSVSVNAPFDDKLWASVTNPTVTYSTQGPGPVSQESSVNVNGDIWYRSVDGLRTWMLARRDIGYWANTSMSFEMSRILDFDDEDLLPWCSAASFDGRLLVTSSPQRVVGHGIVWQALVALDFSEIMGIQTAGQNPVYDGVWQGLNVLQLATIDDRCFMAVLNTAADNRIELWEVTKKSANQQFDEPSPGVRRDIVCWIETPSYNLTGGYDLYRLEKGRLWIDNLQGNVAFAVWWKPDQYPAWQPWNSWTESAKVGLCPPLACPPGSPSQPAFRPYIPLPTPPDHCDTTQNPTRNLRLGFEFQVKIQWTGICRLKKFFIACSEVEETLDEICRGVAPVDLTGIPACGDTPTYSSIP